MYLSVSVIEKSLTIQCVISANEGNKILASLLQHGDHSRDQTFRMPNNVAWGFVCTPEQHVPKRGKITFVFSTPTVKNAFTFHGVCTWWVGVEVGQRACGWSHTVLLRKGRTCYCYCCDVTQ